jgi:rhodanese-related sulfurtransferase
MNTKISSLLEISAVFALAVSPAWSADSKTAAQELRRLQLLRTQNLVIIDVRDPNSYAKGRIQGAGRKEIRPAGTCGTSDTAGARNIPAQSLAAAQLPKDSRIVVYCGEDAGCKEIRPTGTCGTTDTAGACPLSAQATTSLIAAGYTKVQALAGGLADWLKHGYPAETRSQEPYKPKHDHITTKDAQARLASGQAVFLDVRPAREFSAGRIPPPQQENPTEE